ncbi:MAG: TonB-dependent receptor [Saprospiraceae bacterium]|nr:TonB-dependent receptor [Saprospiraceae bacterium]
MRKIFLPLYILFLPLLLLGQHTPLSIRLSDARSGEPLAFATIQLLNTQLGAVADSAGQAVLNIPPGHQALRLRAQMLGYQPQNIVLDQRLDTLEIRLEPLSEALGEVVVSGTLKPMSRSESPVPVEVYTPKFFRANPTPSLFDGLHIVNGVKPQLNCNVCNTGDIHINGLEGPYTMVLIDGMPIVSALSTVYGLQGIPNSLVERIEVVKGPASTLYGSEAVAGLINVITKDPRQAPRFSLDLNHTSYGETSVDLAGRFRTGAMTSLLAANLFRFQQRWDINNDNFTDVTLQDRASVFGKFAFARPKDRLANLALRYVWENRWGGELQWTPQWYGTDSLYGEAIRTNRAELLGNWQLPLDEHITLAYSWNIHDQRSAYGATRYNGRQQIAFAQLLWDKSFGARHDALLGLATRYTWFDDNTAITASPDGQHNLPAQTWLPGVFVQDDIRLSDRHRLLLGLRYDWNSAHGHVLSPRANWKWSPDDLNTFRLSVGNGYRVANVFSEDHAALTGSRRVVLAADLRPERSWNANLNYTTKFFPAFGFVGLDATAFYTHFSNRIIADYTVDPDLVVFDNLSGFGVSRGLTLNSDWNFTNGLTLLAGFTWMEVFNEDHGLRRAQLHAPPFSATWSASFPLPKWNLRVDYTGSLSSPMPLPVVPNDFRPGHSPWFSLQNLQLTWKREALEVYVGVKNLFNFLPQDPLLRPFDPFDKQANNPVSNPHGYTFDTTYNYAPLQGRRLMLGLRWSWAD